MGNQFCVSQKLPDFDMILDPLSSQFHQSTQTTLSHDHDLLFQKIKKIRQVIDPRQNKKLKWYQSKRYGFKFFGQLHRRRPFGQCLFYFDQKDISLKYKEKIQTQKKSPILITTKINKHYVFCPNTLLIYTDRSYYIGQIQAKVYQIPRASGQGLLVTSQFIYQGQFQQGLPGGFGRYHTKFLEYIGKFKQGIPCGQGIQKTSNGMFVGTISQTLKEGFMIKPDNKRVQVSQKNSKKAQLLQSKQRKGTSPSKQRQKNDKLSKNSVTTTK